MSAIPFFTPAHGLLLAAALFAVGAFGVLARRNLLVVLMSLEIMLNAAALALATCAGVLGEAQAGAGQVFVLLVMAVAAAEAGVGLALIMALYRQRGSVDERALSGMEG